MNKYDCELKVLGKFYGKPVYGNPNINRCLAHLKSARDWKFLQFKGEIEANAPSPPECRIKLSNGIQFYLMKRRRTWLDYGWILLYAGEKALKTISVGTNPEVGPLFIPRINPAIS